MKDHDTSMGTMETIYARRSVRSYSDSLLDRGTILELLAAAVQAPTAIHEEPWAFTVIQDQGLLDRLSDAAKKIYHQEIHVTRMEHSSVLHHGMEDPDASLFHDAGTLVVIWAKPLGRFAATDCWLAAENLMLAACALGLGSCVIGSAVAALNTNEWKTSLGVPREWLAIAPLIIGVASAPPPPVSRKKAEIVSWRECRAPQPANPGDEAPSPVDN